MFEGRLKQEAHRRRKVCEQKGIGIPKDSVIKYDIALKTDKYLLIVHGTPDAVDKAKDIISGTRHSFYAVHEAPVLV